MRHFTVLVVLFASAFAAEVSIEQVFEKNWSGFKLKHKKEYEGEEEKKRIQNFLETTFLIETHNAKYHAGEVSYILEHNHMSDLGTEEIMKHHMGFKMPPADKILNGTIMFKSTLGDRQLPKRIDWRDWNIVTPVKNQQQCGSCYAFSATAALETAIARRTRKLVSLSEQQLLDCTEEYGNYGCNGGFMNTLFQYVIDNGGQIAEKDYAYTANKGQCKAKEYKTHGTINNFVVIPKGDERKMAEAVTTVGPLAVAYHAGNRDFAFYKEGIYDSPDCNTEMLSHAVTIIGFGTENGKDYWLCKNSWGKSWGEDGYFRIVRGKNMCGIANMVSYPIA